MRDQATDLRNLVLRAARERADADVETPRVVTVAGAVAAAGATSIAVNAALAVAEQGWRVVLVDADSVSCDAARHCGLPPVRTAATVGRDDLHESLVLGPLGLQIAPCTWDSTLSDAQRDKAAGRLLRQIRSLGRHAEIVVVDLGASTNSLVEKFWRASDALLLVTTPAQQAVVDAYARLKEWLAAGPAPVSALAINRVASAEEAAATFHRLERSARRFLRHPLPLAGWIPEDEAFARAAQRRGPLWSVARGSLAATAIGEMAERWIAHGPDTSGNAQVA